MKIGIFSECYRPTTNGVVVSIDTFRATLTQMGHEIFIFAPRTKDYIDEDPAHVFRLPSFTWPGQKYYPIALPGFGHTLQLAANLSLDIIHCQHLSFAGQLGQNIARRLGLPAVYTYHTLIAEYTHYVPLFHNFAKKYLIKRSRIFCNRSDAVVTPSPSMRKKLLNYGVTTPISVIPTGIYPERYTRDCRPQLLQKFQIPDNRKLLLYVGRLAAEKNIPLLLESLKIIKGKYPAIHLLLVGSGPQEPDYRHWLAQNKLSDYVTFTGFLPKEETEKVFGACDIFTFPSLTDTQGIVVVEAMAAGTPPVAVEALGPADIIHDGVDGFLTDPNVNQFADKIITLLSNQELYQTMSKEAKVEAKKYSAKACAKKMESLYANLTRRYHTQSNLASKSEKNR